MDTLWKLEMLSMPNESKDFAESQRALKRLIASSCGIPSKALAGSYSLALAKEALEALEHPTDIQT